MDNCLFFCVCYSFACVCFFNDLYGYVCMYVCLLVCFSFLFFFFFSFFVLVLVIGEGVGWVLVLLVTVLSV